MLTLLEGPRMRSLLLSAAALLLLAPSVSNAAPITYGFVGGELTLTGFSAGGALFDPVTVALDGVQVTVDTMTPELVSLELTAGGPIELNLSTPYAGYDQIVIESLSLSGGPGLLIPIPGPGSPDEYFYVVNPLTRSGVISASGPGVPAVGPAPFSSDGAAADTLFIDPAANELTLSGVTIGSFGPVGGEPDAITIKGDFVFRGSSDAPIPEPSAALVFAIGMTTFASARRLRRSGGTARG